MWLVAPTQCAEIFIWSSSFIFFSNKGSQDAIAKTSMLTLKSPCNAHSVDTIALQSPEKKYSQQIYTKMIKIKSIKHAFLV